MKTKILLIALMAIVLLAIFTELGQFVYYLYINLCCNSNWSLAKLLVLLVAAIGITIFNTWLEHR